MQKDWIDRLMARAGDIRIDGKPQEIALSAEQAQQLAIYTDLLLDWNTRMNLTAVMDPEEILTKHLLDCMAGLPLLCPAEGKGGAGAIGTASITGTADVAGAADMVGATGAIGTRPVLADVGTGAGFPGMVLAICRPDMDVVLMDALQKRLTFLTAVRDELGLANVRIVHERAEEAGQKEVYREQMDYAAARAVAALPVLLEYCLPFVRTGGSFFAYKGPALPEELAASANALKVLGGKAVGVHEIQVKSEDWIHYILHVIKERPTGKAYPRRQGKISKAPL